VSKTGAKQIDETAVAARFFLSSTCHEQQVADKCNESRTRKNLSLLCSDHVTLTEKQRKRTSRNKKTKRKIK